MEITTRLMDAADQNDSCRARSPECSRLTVENLNGGCFCVTLKEGALRQALQTELDAPDMFTLIEQRWPSAFSARPVFISEAHAARMAAVVAAVERVVALPAYREQVLAGAPLVARHQAHAVRGVFFGYDFHLDGDQIGLIEINTNAGGAMLNAVLARAQANCCVGMFDEIGVAHAQDLENDILAMFQEEWRLAGRQGPLRTIAIVDEAPFEQYLYPEFLLFQRLFRLHQIDAIIADPRELSWRDEVLWHGDTPIDLVYYRSTDFMLENDSSAALRSAYLADAVVLTPHPQAHALYADKRNLALLSNPEKLAALGVDEATRSLLRDHIPRTERVDPTQHARLWSERRGLFFKPASSFGSRGAYRGDKLTKRVWQEILKADYIAQQVIAPGLRVGGTPADPVEMKFDIRLYCYGGKVQWTAARLYQGQTTNFRTAGGGFAPVYVLGETTRE